MAYDNNYPNGYKSGYSSADDPDRKNYSPAEFERQRLEAKERNDTYEDSKKTGTNPYKEMEAEKARRAYEATQKAKHAENVHTVARYKIEEVRHAYQNKNFLGKAITTLKGKNPKQRSTEIRNQAYAEAYKMSESEREAYIAKQAGKSK